MPTGSRYWCDCTAICAQKPGGRDLVPARTWYNHQPHRIQVQSFADFLQGFSNEDHALEEQEAAIVSRSRKRKRRRPHVEDEDSPGHSHRTPHATDTRPSSRAASPCAAHHDNGANDEPLGNDEPLAVQEDILLEPPDLLKPPLPETDPLASGVPEAEATEPAEADEALPDSTREDIKNALRYIELLRSATLGSSGLEDDVLEQLQNPLQEELKITDPDVVLSIELYMASANGSKETYDAIRDAITRRDVRVEVLSYYKVKRTIEKLTGICSVVHDMCINSCVGFTGHREALDKCPKCSQAWYCPIRSKGTRLVGRQQFSTILPGPQIQALYRSPETAKDMTYLYDRCVEILERVRSGAGLTSYGDFSSGSLLLEAIANGTITKEDVVLLFSLDGAQLYRNKQSDCWIYIWVVANLSPDKRYKKRYILVGGVIPGPKHPDDLDSFMFPGFLHVSALMRDGLKIWNAHLETESISRIFLALGMADGPAMAAAQGTVGHHGARGCRIYCGMVGRHKPGCPHYYPALLRPSGPAVPGSNHDDILLPSIRLPSPEEYQRNLQLIVSADTDALFKQLRRATGLCKPSIFSGLSRTFPLPLGFPVDLMHLTGLNLPDLFMGLFRGVIKGSTQSDAKTWECAVLQGNTWVNHGKRVERAMNFLPGFHDRPPRNIAEKISSGYKAAEFQTYMYKYAPFMLRSVLGRPYWTNLCKIARAVTVLHLVEISRSELLEAKGLLDDAVVEFEELYYARDIHQQCAPSF
ncbi:hypothetical protein ACG7TL_002133 [Trametes sanguinea]